jgi:hypothetical protein
MILEALYIDYNTIVKHLNSDLRFCFHFILIKKLLCNTFVQGTNVLNKCIVIYAIHLYIYTMAVLRIIEYLIEIWFGVGLVMLEKSNCINLSLIPTLSRTRMMFIYISIGM